ncbi:MAG: EamA family transporter [Gemmataceae bacterium]
MNTLKSAEARTISTTIDPLPGQEHRPIWWAIPLAFTLLYSSWGTTFLAIRIGVHEEHLPPGLFSGTRVTLAGLMLFAYMWLRGQPLGLPRRDLFWLSVTSLLMFVGGNGLITLALGEVPSGVTSILAATLPLWLGLMETVRPRGERLAWTGWLGLIIGLSGVVLVAQLRSIEDLWNNPGPLYIMLSAIFWALGSLLMRQHRPSGSHLSAAAYQMVLGGTALALVGLACGEGSLLAADHFNQRSALAFAYLLVVGSLIGFLAYTYLLGHVSATLVGTYAYVTPMVAVLVGWLIAGEEMSPRILIGMGIVLGSVALVRHDQRAKSGTSSTVPAPLGEP